MSDLSEFQALQSAKGPQCGVATALGALDEQDRANAEAAIKAVHEIRAITIVRWFAKRDLKVTPTSMTRHRRGECMCGKDA